MLAGGGCEEGGRPGPSPGLASPPQGQERAAAAQRELSNRLQNRGGSSADLPPGCRGCRRLGRDTAPAACTSRTQQPVQRGAGASGYRHRSPGCSELRHDALPEPLPRCEVRAPQQGRAGWRASCRDVGATEDGRGLHPCGRGARRWHLPGATQRRCCWGTDRG